MRYTTAIDIWAAGVQAALKSGNLRLQSGQWVTLGPGGTRSRFDYVDTGTGFIRAYHGGGSKSAAQNYINSKRRATRIAYRLLATRMNNVEVSV